MTGQLQKFLSLTAGIIIALFLYFANPFGVDANAVKVLAVAGLMITWWVTDALPMPVVALLPIIFFPLLGVSPIKEVSTSYANPVIYLFMGGFMLGLAIEKWNLHKRIALTIISIVGTSGNRIILGFIVATGLISMWISNTATTMMMFPIAISVINVMEEHNKGKGNIRNFSLAIMLSIAYASNLAGISTIIGTPPNLAYAGYIKQTIGYNISFMNWMAVCTPLAILLLFCLYWVLVKLLFPNHIQSSEATHDFIRKEIQKLGSMTIAEKRVLVIFIATALLWMFRGLITKITLFSKLDDTIIALLAAIALFICPSGSKDSKNSALLEWSDTSKMAWGILILFGGGIALAGALEKAGLIEQLGLWLAQFSGNTFLLIVLVCVIGIFLSELMSNLAQVIVFAPVLTSLAIALKMDPLLLGIPMTLAASCAGMLPMGTPPNAIVFASGHIQLKDMLKAGLVMNLVSVALIVLFSWFVLPLVMRTG